MKSYFLKIKRFNSTCLNCVNLILIIRKIWRLEQYGRRLCLRIDGILLKSNETSENVLDSVKNLFELAEVNIPDVVVDCAHRIGLILCFTQFIIRMAAWLLLTFFHMFTQFKLYAFHYYMLKSTDVWKDDSSSRR